MDSRIIFSLFLFQAMFVFSAEEQKDMDQVDSVTICLDRFQKAQRAGNYLKLARGGLKYSLRQGLPKQEVAAWKETVQTFSDSFQEAVAAHQAALMNNAHQQIELSKEKFEEEVKALRTEKAVRVLQDAFRRNQVRKAMLKEEQELERKMYTAAVAIQSLVRGCHERYNLKKAERGFDRLAATHKMRVQRAKYQELIEFCRIEQQCHLEEAQAAEKAAKKAAKKAAARKRKKERQRAKKAEERALQDALKEVDACAEESIDFIKNRMIQDAKRVVRKDQLKDIARKNKKRRARGLPLLKYEDQEKDEDHLEEMVTLFDGSIQELEYESTEDGLMQMFDVMYATMDIDLSEDLDLFIKCMQDAHRDLNLSSVIPASDFNIVLENFIASKAMGAGK